MSGWKLTQECFGILRNSRELMILPIVGAFASFIVTILFSLPLAFADRLENELLIVLMLFAYYFVQQLTVLFTSSALLHMVVQTFKGEKPTLADGIAFSVSRLDKIVSWACLGGVVGVILNRLDKGSEESKVRRFLIKMVGGAWSLVSYFAFPVLVLEGLGPKEALRRSIALILDAWGPRKRATQGFQMISFLAILAGSVVLMIGVALTQYTGALIWLCVSVGLLVPYAFFGTFLIISLKQIFRAALYVYATDSTVELPISKPMLEGAFG